MPAKKVPLSEKLATFKQTGRLNLGSDDLKDAAMFDPPPQRPKAEPVPEKVDDGKTEANTEGRVDPLMDRAAQNIQTPQSLQFKASLQQSVAAQAGLSTPQAPAEETKVDITDLDRQRFLDAVVTGARMLSEEILFGGRLLVQFRSRKQNETLAIISQLGEDLRSMKIRNNVEHMSRMRSMLFACQIAQIDNRKFPEWEEPVHPQIVDGKPVDPKWLDSLDYFEKLSDALSEALFSALKRFDMKYWTMVNAAKDQDFWSPVGSA